METHYCFHEFFIAVVISRIYFFWRTLCASSLLNVYEQEQTLKDNNGKNIYANTYLHEHFLPIKVFIFPLHKHSWIVRKNSCMWLQKGIKVEITANTVQSNWWLLCEFVFLNCLLNSRIFRLKMGNHNYLFWPTEHKQFTTESL